MQWRLKWEQGGEPPSPPHFNHWGRMQKVWGRKSPSGVQGTNPLVGLT